MNEEILKERPRRRYNKSRYNIEEAATFINRKSANDQINIIENNLDINLGPDMQRGIKSAYDDVSYILKTDDLLNSFTLVKTVYEALFGDTTGFEEFINYKQVLAYASYSRMRYRLAIFNHFGFLKEVFINNTELLIPKFFDKITTFDIYRILSVINFNNLGDFINYVNGLNCNVKDKFHSIKIDEDEMRELDSELMDTLQSLKKKNSFLKLMESKRKNNSEV